MRPKLIKERIAEIREAHSKSTKVVAWYPHAHEKQVRGPFGRWFECSGGDNGMKDPVKYPVPVAEIADDVKYCALAMNAVPELLIYIDALEDENQHWDTLESIARGANVLATDQIKELRSKLDIAEKALKNIHHNAAYDMNKAETNHDRERFEILFRAAEKALKEIKG